MPPEGWRGDGGGRREVACCVTFQALCSSVCLCVFVDRSSQRGRQCSFCRGSCAGWLQRCLLGFVVCFKVLTVSFSFPCHFVCFCLLYPSTPPPPPPLTHPVQQPACIPHAGVMVLWCRPPSSPPPRSHLSPPLPHPRLLTDPPPQSLAGTPCRTV